ncbi:ABC transporter, ATP-binding protein [[Actinomadura] parvosata subsp. kistnae]|uniref:ABC transporter ATP-binding protein n=1 Tax=[Actinomadura] parvosata subsp. kistnae TaxID=1909395 RepID=A0A1V0AD31_9ACTN|nr:ABC transporter ATP-binding protein [Nonomuraea sp. ATCC 55076]AQZ68128.1 ABC transporter ATP-binding protein [Nonomuraea sp. ATCC 55076]SPL93484.1 ABC transporter, ATP-binding protein [Actinomadura parvosata subsp. kistnae]
MTVLARAIDVTRRYGGVRALDGVSLDIRAGELVGLLGPNGAGKSTLINLLVGLRRPTSGTVELFGGSPLDPVMRRGIGVTPQETGLPESLRVGEIVDFVSAHYPERLGTGELLARFGLGELVRRQVGGLSGGQRRRLAVALAFAGRPKLVFLDEPTTGLDVEARRALWDGIKAFHEDGGTVLLTSHYLEEVEALAERVLVVGQGRVLADDTMRAVRGLVGTRRVSLVADRLPDLPGVLSAERVDGRIDLVVTDPDRLVVELVRAGVPFSGLEIRPATLEEAFLALTTNPPKETAHV